MPFFLYLFIVFASIVLRLLITLLVFLFISIILFITLSLLRIISIVRILQNANEIFNQFKISISKSIIEDAQIKEVNDVTERYIEICTLFDTLFSLSRTIYGEITCEIIEKLMIII